MLQPFFKRPKLEEKRSTLPETLGLHIARTDLCRNIMTSVADEAECTKEAHDQLVEKLLTFCKDNDDRRAVKQIYAKKCVPNVTQTWTENQRIQTFWSVIRDYVDFEIEGRVIGARLKGENNILYVRIPPYGGVQILEYRDDILTLYETEDGQSWTYTRRNFLGRLLGCNPLAAMTVAGATENPANMDSVVAQCLSNPHLTYQKTVSAEQLQNLGYRRDYPGMMMSMYVKFVRERGGSLGAIGYTKMIADNEIVVGANCLFPDVHAQPQP